jgi:hypothetical protein
MALPPVLSSIVSWLRAGYPCGVPESDYIPLLALLARRLTAEEVSAVAAELVHQVEPAAATDGSDGAVPGVDNGDIGVMITKITNEMPREEDIARVRSQLATAGPFLCFCSFWVRFLWSRSMHDDRTLWPRLPPPYRTPLMRGGDRPEGVSVDPGAGCRGRATRHCGRTSRGRGRPQVEGRGRATASQALVTPTDDQPPASRWGLVHTAPRRGRHVRAHQREAADPRSLGGALACSVRTLRVGGRSSAPPEVRLVLSGIPDPDRLFVQLLSLGTRRALVSRVPPVRCRHGRPLPARAGTAGQNRACSV